MMSLNVCLAKTHAMLQEFTAGTGRFKIPKVKGLKLCKMHSRWMGIPEVCNDYLLMLTIAWLSYSPMSLGDHLTGSCCLRGDLDNMGKYSSWFLPDHPFWRGVYVYIRLLWRMVSLVLDRRAWQT